jgi:hypothetical protein
VSSLAELFEDSTIVGSETKSQSWLQGCPRNRKVGR